MIKTFFIGTIIGLLGAGAFAWYVPPVDLHRERSIVTVRPNGGNIEEFRINLPHDRIMVGLSAADASIPAALDWPDAGEFGDLQAELFKIRDRNDIVVGLASRLASASEASGAFIEWSLHLPARGTLYVGMEVTPSEDGTRDGILKAGTRDFDAMSGSFREQFVAADEDGDGSQGFIALQAMLVGQHGDNE